MELTIYQVDAFTEKAFSGNPAAVVPLENWLPDETMQNIALENNLSETAFFIPTNSGFYIRWFTPAAEVDLCGHATLATAHVLFTHLNYTAETIRFDSRSGELIVRKEKNTIILDFPVSEIKEIAMPNNLVDAFNFKALKSFGGRDDIMLVFENEDQIRLLEPDFNKIIKLKTRGIICTAPSENVDFVSRFFAPAVGVPEDPVTGSAHTMLIPFWSKKLGKQKLMAKQISKRGGTIYCQNKLTRVEIGGKAITYLIGKIYI